MDNIWTANEIRSIKPKVTEYEWNTYWVHVLSILEREENKQVEREKERQIRNTEYFHELCQSL